MQIQFSSRTSNLQKIELCSLVPTPLRCGLEARAACKYGDIINPLLAGQWMETARPNILLQIDSSSNYQSSWLQYRHLSIHLLTWPLYN